jgi:hypothetical protein
VKKKFLSFFLIFPAYHVSADEPIDPLHFLTANWSVEARSDSAETAFGGLSYGFRQFDLESDPPAVDYVLAGNDCLARASMRTVSPFIAPAMSVSGQCAAETSLPVLSESEFFVVLPGGEFPPFTFSDVELPVERSALKGEDGAFSTSFGIYGLTAETLGFESHGFTQSFVAEKSENAQFADLAGDWAFTRLELEVEPGGNEANYTVLTFPAAITDGGALFAAAGVEFIESEFFHFLDGSGVEKRRFEATVEASDISAPFTLSSDGRISFNTGDTGQPGRNPQVFGGFVAPSFDFLVMAEGVPGVYPLRQGDDTLPDVDLFSAHQVFVGIKRTANPELLNKRYRLVGLKYHPNAETFELAAWKESAQLTFASGMQGSWQFEADGKQVKLDNGELAGIMDFSQSATIPFEYLVEDDGRIYIDLSGTEGVEESLVNGYASPNSEVLVFSHALSLDDARHGEIGMWIALCTNCRQTGSISDAVPVSSLNTPGRFLMILLMLGIGLAGFRLRVGT